MGRVALVVEDDRVSAVVLEEWLRRRGWAVECVYNGRAGLRSAQELRPTLVLADVLLPEVDGIALCGQIRLQPFGERVWIGLLSGLADVRGQAMAAGADFFLTKPIDFHELERCLERLDSPEVELEIQKELRDMAPIRVPVAPVLGDYEIGWQEEGELAPGRLPVLLRDLYDRQFTGVLEAGATKVFFDRGSPAAARSADRATAFAQILQGMRVAPPEVLEASIEEARRAGMAVGEVLLSRGLIDHRTVERAIQEQILARVLGLRAGRYRLQAAEPMGLACFAVHPAVLAWRAGEGAGVEAPPDRFVSLDAAALEIQPLLEPQEELRPVWMLMRAGASVRACLSASATAARLLGLLLSWQLARLETAPPPARGEAAGGRSAEAVEEELSRRLRTLADADSYTVLGLRPDTDTEGVHAATVSLLAGLQPEALPAGLSAEGQRRARLLCDRVREAGRVLADPGRRGIYDAQLARARSLSQRAVGSEDQAELQAERARHHLRRGAFVTAAALFAKALDQHGSGREGARGPARERAREQAEILAQLGWSRHRACPEDRSLGEAELQRALTLDPDGEYALYYLGRMRIARGQRDQGRSLLRQALGRNHAFEEAREALAEAEAGGRPEQGRPEQGRPEQERPEQGRPEQEG